MRVVAVAIKIGSIVITMPRPHRHRDIIKSLLEECNDPCRIALESSDNDNQGFILSDGSFASREAAAKIAVNSGQAPPGTTRLNSQHLW